MELSYNQYIGTLTIRNDETTFHTYKLHNETLNAIDYLSNCVTKKDKEIERLHSIISEAKNKINDIEFRIAGKDFNYYFKLKDMEQGKELLKVLDKVEENSK